MIQAGSKLRFLALKKSVMLGSIFVAADLSIGMAAQNNAIVTFPGASNESSAQYKRLLVRNIETGTLDDDEHYTLFLDDLITKQSQKLVGYGRTIDVAWAPDSKKLFVTNWIGSNVADCEGFDVKDPSKIHSV
jgi:hypothetical protein